MFTRMFVNVISGKINIEISCEYEIASFFGYQKLQYFRVAITEQNIYSKETDIKCMRFFFMISSINPRDHSTGRKVKLWSIMMQAIT